MRITIVSRIYRPEPSAASLFLGSTADELLARGHAVEVLTARPPAGLAAAVDTRERVRTFPVIRDRRGYVRGYIPYLSFDLPLAFRLLFARRPDLVFVEPPPTTGAVVRVVCALRRIRYVYDAADVWSDAAEMATTSPLVIRVLRALERFGMNGAAHIVTISQGVADRVRELGVVPDVTVTGFGADTTAFGFAPAAADSLFVYAGSYSAWHGTDILIDAFADFLQSHSAYRLLFIGTGTEREVLEQKADSLGIRESIEFADTVPPAELVPLLARATATLATLKPGIGYDYAFTSKAYSSLASGTPVIFAGPGPTAPFIAAANEHVRAGSAVAWDAAAIAAEMRRLADDPLSPAERSELALWTAREHSMGDVGIRVAQVLEGTARSGS